MDDFDERDELPEEQEQRPSLRDGVDRARQKYDDAKEGIDKAKELRGKFRGAQQASNAAGTTGATTAGSTAAAGTATTGATAAGTAAGTAATGAAAGTAATGAAAGAAATGAAAAGTGAAVAASATGVGAIAVAAAAALKAGNEKFKKMDENKKMAVKAAAFVAPLSTMFLPIILIVMLFLSLVSWLGNEDAYSDLSTIIQKREIRYAPEGKTTTSLLLMTDAQIKEILYRDYDMKKTDQEKDPCLSTVLEKDRNNEHDELIPTKTMYQKMVIVEKYLKSEKANFNKIKWKGVTSSGNFNVDLDNYQDLKIPNYSKYKMSPEITQDEQYNAYADMLKGNLQKWVVPYSINVATTDNKFAQDVLDNMWHPIDVSIFQLDRLTETTTTYYYLETRVKADHYKKVPDPDRGTGYVPTFHYEYSHTTYFDSTTASSYHDSSTVNYTITKKKDADGNFIRAGIRIPASSKDMTDPYRFVPKTTYVEDLYNIIKVQYYIRPPDKTMPPVEESTTLDENGKELIIKKWDESLGEGSLEMKEYKLSYYDEEQTKSLGRKISRIEWYQDYGAGKNEIYPAKTAEELARVKKKYFIPNEADKTKKPEIQGYSYADLDFAFQQIDKYYSGSSVGGIGMGGNITLYDVPEGGFLFPVPESLVAAEYNIDYTITANYGWYSPFGKLEFHTGMDIAHKGIGNPGNNAATSYGPRVVAAADGIAYRRYMPNGYGDPYILIDHENGYFTLYGHLYSSNISNGQKVKQGDVIGIMGTKGYSTAVHLHFEIIKADDMNSITKSSKLNPRLFFNDDGTSILSTSKEDPEKEEQNQEQE